MRLRFCSRRSRCDFYCWGRRNGSSIALVQHQMLVSGDDSITNFAGPMNKFFCPDIIVYLLPWPMQGGAVDYYSKLCSSCSSWVVATWSKTMTRLFRLMWIQAFPTGMNWQILSKATHNQGKTRKYSERDGKTKKWRPNPEDGDAIISVTNAVKTGFFDKLQSGVTDTYTQQISYLNGLEGYHLPL